MGASAVVTILLRNINFVGTFSLDQSQRGQSSDGLAVCGSSQVQAGFFVSGFRLAEAQLQTKCFQYASSFKAGFLVFLISH